MQMGLHSSGVSNTNASPSASVAVPSIKNCRLVVIGKVYNSPDTVDPTNPTLSIARTGTTFTEVTSLLRDIEYLYADDYWYFTRRQYIWTSQIEPQSGTYNITGSTTGDTGKLAVFRWMIVTNDCGDAWLPYSVSGTATEHNYQTPTMQAGVFRVGVIDAFYRNGNIVQNVSSMGEADADNLYAAYGQPSGGMYAGGSWTYNDYYDHVTAIGTPIATTIPMFAMFGGV